MSGAGPSTLASSRHAPCRASRAACCSSSRTRSASAHRAWPSRSPATHAVDLRRSRLRCASIDGSPVAKLNPAGTERALEWAAVEGVATGAVPLPAELDDGGAEAAAAVVEHEVVEHVGDVDVVVGVRTPRDRAAVRDRTEAHRRRLEMPVVAPVGDQVAVGVRARGRCARRRAGWPARCRCGRRASPTTTCPARPRTARRRRQGASCSRRSPRRPRCRRRAGRAACARPGRDGSRHRRARAEPRTSSRRAPRHSVAPRANAGCLRTMSAQ